MTSINVYDLLRRRVLVTRGSAREMRPRIADAVTAGSGEISLDLSGVHGVAPSFLDEMLSLIERCTVGLPSDQFRVTIDNPPTELSSKFLAVARAHDLSIEVSQDGDWVDQPGLRAYPLRTTRPLPYRPLGAGHVP